MPINCWPCLLKLFSFPVTAQAQSQILGSVPRSTVAGTLREVDQSHTFRHSKESWGNHSPFWREGAYEKTFIFFSWNFNVEKKEKKKNPDQVGLLLI